MPFREEMAKRHLKVSGDLGRVIFMVNTPLVEPTLDTELEITRNMT